MIKTSNGSFNRVMFDAEKVFAWFQHGKHWEFSTGEAYRPRCNKDILDRMEHITLVQHIKEALLYLQSYQIIKEYKRKHSGTLHKNSFKSVWIVDERWRGALAVPWRQPVEGTAPILAKKLAAKAKSKFPTKPTSKTKVQKKRKVQVAEESFPIPTPTPVEEKPTPAVVLEEQKPTPEDVAEQKQSEWMDTATYKETMVGIKRKEFEEALKAAGKNPEDYFAPPTKTLFHRLGDWWVSFKGEAK